MVFPTPQIIVSSFITHFQRFGAEHGQGGVVDVDVDEGIGELHGGVGLVVHVVILPRHQLARRRLSRPRRTGEPEDLALLLGLWRDVGAAAHEITQTLMM